VGKGVAYSSANIKSLTDAFNIDSVVLANAIVIGVAASRLGQGTKRRGQSGFTVATVCGGGILGCGLFDFLTFVGCNEGCEVLSVDGTMWAISPARES
jgi:hypothetical protein